jgi:hypothetical protein
MLEEGDESRKEKRVVRGVLGEYRKRRESKT